MLILPADIMALLNVFAPVFSRRIWRHVPILVAGVILAPGRRTISTVLRAVGRGQVRTFQTYHRVLNRAVWSGLSVSRILLGLLVVTFAPTGPLVVGIDETIERRRGPKIAAAGIYRDPVRSSHSHFVKVNGLRWICLHLLVPIPWAGHTRALPFLYRASALRTLGSASTPALQAAHTVGAPTHPPRASLATRSPARGRRRPSVRGAGVARGGAPSGNCRRPLAPGRASVFTCSAPLPPPDRAAAPLGARLPTLATYAADPATAWTTAILSRWYGERDRPIQLLSGTAAWYHTGLPPVAVRWVLLRDPRGQFATQAVLCTVDPLQSVSWFILRWQLEATFREVRAHLGVETQRQWSDQVIARTTPTLLGLFSVVTVLADGHLRTRSTFPCRPSAWDSKSLPTVVDALALVRRHLWASTAFPMSAADADLVKVPRVLVEHLHELLCYAA